MSEETENWMEQSSFGGSMVPPEQEAAALDFARNYLVFVDDARGRALLQHWVETLGRKRLSPGASHPEYAYAEAQRAFVQGIEDQLRFVQTRG